MSVWNETMCILCQNYGKESDCAMCAYDGYGEEE